MRPVDLLWFIAAVVCAAAGTWRVRSHALQRGMLDIPNQRSSHTNPTPRGGGIAIATVVLVGTAILWALGALASAPTLAILAGGAAVAIVGYIDDRKGLRAAPRALVHLIAAALVAVLLVRHVAAVGVRDWPDVLLIAVYTFCIGWSINLFNFMDGIDGIAGSQALFVGSAALS